MNTRTFQVRLNSLSYFNVHGMVCYALKQRSAHHNTDQNRTPHVIIPQSELPPHIPSMCLYYVAWNFEDEINVWKWQLKSEKAHSLVSWRHLWRHCDCSTPYNVCFLHINIKFEITFFPDTFISFVCKSTNEYNFIFLNMFFPHFIGMYRLALPISIGCLDNLYCMTNYSHQELRSVLLPIFWPVISSHSLIFYRHQCYICTN